MVRSVHHRIVVVFPRLHRDKKRRLWADTAKALSLPPEPLPPLRVIKERRATFAQTPAALARRLPARTRWSNLFLAGDWTDTGYPATIESAVRSGRAAARAAAG